MSKEEADFFWLEHPIWIEYCESACWFHLAVSLPALNRENEKMCSFTVNLTLHSLWQFYCAFNFWLLFICFIMSAGASIHNTPFVTLGMMMSVWWSVHHFSLYGNISAVGWIDVKFCTDICVPQRMKSSDFCDPLTFPPSPSAGLMVLSEMFSLDFHEIWYRFSWRPDHESYWLQWLSDFSFSVSCRSKISCVQLNISTSACFFNYLMTLMSSSGWIIVTLVAA